VPAPATPAAPRVVSPCRLPGGHDAPGGHEELSRIYRVRQAARVCPSVCLRCSQDLGRLFLSSPAIPD